MTDPTLAALLREVPGLHAIDRMLSVGHRGDLPCACDGCMEYGAEDTASDWHRIPVANRIVMRILDSGDDRMAALVKAFRDHEADAPQAEAAPPPLDVERLRGKLHQMANVAAEKRPLTDVARGYERACDELLEWLCLSEAPTPQPEAG